MKQFKFIDLFCGIGGFHIALKSLGGECVLACDIDEKCRESYLENYGIEPKQDVTKLIPSEIPDFDVLSGGFPCQPFSNAGNKKSFGDSRGGLFDYIIKIAKEKQPKFMFLENVKHIKKISDGKVFDYILKEIGDTGYNCKVFELSPHELGIPQQRERVIFACIRNDVWNPELVIDLELNPKIKCDFKRIFEKNVDPKYKISKETETLLETWDSIIQKFDTGESLSPTILCQEFYKTYSETEFIKLPKWKQDYIVKNKRIYEKYKDDWDVWFSANKDILIKREVNSKLEWQVGKKLENDSIFNHFIQIRQSGIRVKKSKFFPTLVAIVQTPIYGKERRYLTPRECARLQSFPDSFKLHKDEKVAYKQLGNAVNVDVVRHIISAVFLKYVLLE